MAAQQQEEGQQAHGIAPHKALLGWCGMSFGLCHILGINIYVCLCLVNRTGALN
jgi:hypothetical protein